MSIKEEFKIGNCACKLGIITENMLADSLEEYENDPKKSLIQILLEKNFISNKQISDILKFKDGDLIQNKHSLLEDSINASTKEQQLIKTQYFGKYKILDKIAKGGMGVIYKAKNINLDKTVALKLIKTDIESEEDKERLFREARAAAKLSHPNIVPVYDIGEFGNVSYCSMEYIEGDRLDEWAKKKKKELPFHTYLNEISKIIAQIALALHYAHQNNIVHRDIKPHNILINKEGAPKITDFGLAKDLTNDTRLTVSGQILGTPAYMSPEQATGRTKDTTSSTDIYSLGAVFYELITGKQPFRGNSIIEILDKVISDYPPPLSKYVKNAPIDLQAIIEKSMHKEPEKRYSSGSDLADDINRFIQGKTILAKPTTGVEKFSRILSRNKKVSALIILLILASILLIKLWINDFSSSSQVKEIKTQFSTQQKNIKIRDKANKYLQKGLISNDLDKSIEYFTTAINIDPEWSELYIRRAIAYSQIINYPDAVKDLSKAIQMDPENKKALCWKILLCSSSFISNTKQAEKDYAYLKQIDPNGYYSEISKARILLNQAQIEEALSQINLTISKNPEKVEGYLVRYIIYKTKKTYKLAIKDIDKIIEFDKNYAILLYTIKAQLYTNIKEYKKARNCLTIALEMYPTRLTYNSLLNLYLVTKQVDKAESVVRTMDKENFVDEENYLQLAALMYNNKNLKSLDMINKALEIKPDYERALKLKIKILIFAGDIKEGYKACIKFIKSFPDDKSIYREYAFIQLRLSNIKAASQYIDYFIRLNPKDAEAYLIRSEIYYNKMEIESAISDLKYCIQLSEAQEAYETLIKYYYNTKQYLNALKYVPIALKKFPDNCNILLYKATMLTIYERYYDALETFDLIEKIDPIPISFLYYKAWALFDTAQFDAAKIVLKKYLSEYGKSEEKNISYNFSRAKYMYGLITKGPETDIQHCHIAMAYLHAHDFKNAQKYIDLFKDHLLEILKDPNSNADFLILSIKYNLTIYSIESYSEEIHHNSKVSIFVLLDKLSASVDATEFYKILSLPCFDEFRKTKDFKSAYVNYVFPEELKPYLK